MNGLTAPSFTLRDFVPFATCMKYVACFFYFAAV
jgi:hypothetical protein